MYISNTSLSNNMDVLKPLLHRAISALELLVSGTIMNCYSAAFQQHDCVVSNRSLPPNQHLVKGEVDNCMDKNHMIESILMIAFTGSCSVTCGHTTGEWLPHCCGYM